MNFVTFNQDFSCLAVGTKNGYRIYNCDPFGKCFEQKEGDVTVIEMLFATSLVAVIVSPRRLSITNTKRHSTICELTFPTAILAVKLNRKRLVVVLEEQIYIYDISNMKLLFTIETSPNPHAIFALSPSSERCYLAYPMPTQQNTTPFSPPSHAPPGASTSPASTGHVILYDAWKCEAVNVVEAHKSPLSALSLNSEGTLLATASDKGTIIRVFSVPVAQKLYQFRRGTYPSRIYSMSFNLPSTLLCVSSATETVHIFRLGENWHSPSNGGNSKNEDNNTKHSQSHAGSSKEDSTIYGQFYGGSSKEGDNRYSQTHGRSPGEDTTRYSPLYSSHSTASEYPIPHSNSPPSSSLSPSPSKYGSSFASSGIDALVDSKRRSAIGSMIRRGSQSIGRTMIGAVGGYLPSAMTEMWEPARDFAHVKLPTPGVKSVVAMSSTSPQIMVVTSEGFFYVYNVDMEKGGECIMTKQYSLLDSSEKLGNSVMYE